MGREPKASAVPPMFDAIFCILWPLCMAGVRRSFGRSLMCPLGSCLGRSPGQALSVWTPSLQTGGFCLLLLLHGGIQKQYGTKGEDCQEKKPHTGLKKRGAAAGGHPGVSRIRGLGGAVRAAGTPAGGGAPRSVPAPGRNLRPPPAYPLCSRQRRAGGGVPPVLIKKPRHFHAGAAGHSIISGMPSPSMSR